MDIHKAQEIIKNAIEGQPNSLLSEHYNGLKQVYDLLSSLRWEKAWDEAAVWIPPESNQINPLQHYHITITLEGEFVAEDEDEAWEMAIDSIIRRDSSRKMQICDHTIEEVKPNEF